ncbi:cytochrome b/b6 domain-containing protein [Deferribacter abyssi]|uniref:cytochrome b/b6 domain-containing protein n=1 Tax=Deferribacter abyssi TaxID=213806 RepID=UPI003C167C2E
MLKKADTKIEVFNQIIIWYHKHIIHFMFFFIITGLPILSDKFKFLAYIFGIPVSWLGEINTSAEILSVGIQVARIFHRVTALFFIIASIPFVIVMLKDIKSWHIWPEKWGIKAFFGGIKDLYKTYIKFEHPEIGKYNMGQKLFAWFIIFAMIMMTASGWILAFRDFYSENLWQWARAIHAIFFILIIFFLIIHIYIGTHPINRCGLKAIFRTGETDLEHIKEKHPRWYNKLKNL